MNLPCHFEYLFLFPCQNFKYTSDRLDCERYAWNWEKVLIFRYVFLFKKVNRIQYKYFSINWFNSILGVKNWSFLKFFDSEFIYGFFCYFPMKTYKSILKVRFRCKTLSLIYGFGSDFSVNSQRNICWLWEITLEGWNFFFESE